MTQTVRFTKMHGLGNDFIVIDDRENTLKLSTDHIKKLCDRRFGIGADGIILVHNAVDDHADFSWWFANSDGTFPEMCGNGTRCFARYVFDNGLLDEGQNEFILQTLDGDKPIRIFQSARGFEKASVEMGIASCKPKDTGVDLKANEEDLQIDAPLVVQGVLYHVTAVTMGNPHAVLFVDESGIDQSDETVLILGPRIEEADEFPEKTNVEFVRIIDKSCISMRVWERGVGETLACGTGACAAAFAAYKKGLINNSVKVQLLGGNLHIDIASDDSILMTGPAESAFTGTVTLI